MGKRFRGKYRVVMATLLSAVLLMSMAVFLPAQKPAAATDLSILDPTLNNIFYWLTWDTNGMTAVSQAKSRLQTFGVSGIASLIWPSGPDSGVLPLTKTSIDTAAGVTSVATLLYDSFSLTLTGPNYDLSKLIGDESTVENLLPGQNLVSLYQFFNDAQTTGMSWAIQNNGGTSTVKNILTSSSNIFSDSALQSLLSAAFQHTGGSGSDKDVYDALTKVGWTVSGLASAEVAIDQNVDSSYAAQAALLKAYVRSQAHLSMSVGNQSPTGVEETFIMPAGGSISNGRLLVMGTDVTSQLNVTASPPGVFTVSNSGGISIAATGSAGQPVEVTAYYNNPQTDWVYKGLILPAGAQVSSGSASAPVSGGNMTVTASGSGDFTLVVCQGNPQATSPALNNVIYFDLRILPGSAFATLTINIPASSSTTARYWNGSAWVSVASSQLSYSSGFLTITVNSGSTAPSLSDLTGTAFAVGTVPSGGGGGGGGVVTIAISPTSLPDGTMGQPYSASFSASGGTSPYSFAVTSGSLPDGLSLSSAGRISGTPTKPGSSKFTVTATDANQRTGSGSYKLLVRPAAAPVSKPVTVPADVYGNWAQPYIVALLNAGVVNGYPDGNFYPDRYVTRGELATMLVKALGIQPPADYSILKQFEDYQGTPDWSKPYLAAAVKAGLLNGIGTDQVGVVFLGADRNITRVEAGAVLGREFPTIKPVALTFTDSTSVPSWADQDLGRAVAKGIFLGYPDNTFQPMKYITRAEAAVVIDRFMNAQ